MTENQEKLKHLKAVKQDHQDELMQKPNVVGVAIGKRKQNGKLTDEVALVVMVSKKVPVDQIDPEDILPSQIEGVPVDVQQVGDIRALS